MKSYLARRGYSITDVGTNSSDSVDYPEFAHQLAAQIGRPGTQHGILVCGTGIGMAMAANRHAHIRAAVCHSEAEARMSRTHNNANVLCLGARLIDEPSAERLVDIFLTTDFEGGRHQHRIEKLTP